MKDIFFWVAMAALFVFSLPIFGAIWQCSKGWKRKGGMLVPSKDKEDVREGRRFLLLIIVTLISVVITIYVRG